MSIAKYKYFKIENIAGLRKIIINNPKKKNSLNLQAYQELTDALRAAALDDSVTISAVTGTGEYYSSGNDLTAFLVADEPQKMLATSRPILQNLIKAFYTFPKLLVCVVNGPCIGIAATTAVLSDVIYASETAYFHTPFSALGLCAEGCASYTFPKILGISKASEMLLLNHKLSAEEAYKFQLISEIIKSTEFESKLWPKLVELSKLPKESILVTKSIMKKFELPDLDKACELELEELYKRFASEAFLESIIKFMERKSKL